MESYARNFVKISVLSIVIGMLLGLGMASSEVMMRYLPVHTHLLLVGFMANMIFGVGYHIIPRFQGHAIIPWAWDTCTQCSRRRGMRYRRCFSIRCPMKSACAGLSIRSRF